MGWGAALVAFGTAGTAARAKVGEAHARSGRLLLPQGVEKREDVTQRLPGRRGRGHDDGFLLPHRGVDRLFLVPVELVNAARAKRRRERAAQLEPGRVGDVFLRRGEPLAVRRLRLRRELLRVFLDAVG